MQRVAVLEAKLPVPSATLDLGKSCAPLPSIIPEVGEHDPGDL